MWNNLIHGSFVCKTECLENILLNKIEMFGGEMILLLLKKNYTAEK